MAFSALLNVPVFAKVLGVLALVVVINLLVRSLLASILVGSLVLGVWLGHPVATVARIAWQRFASADNLFLMGTFFLIVWLSALMAETGVMRDLVQTAQARMPRRLSMAALPAIVGLLPMPGGAVFSAPLVERADGRGELAPELKARTNYWFRHVWEYCWPLYPGVILALDLSGLPVWQFMLAQLPVTALAIGSGALFLLRKIPREDWGSPPERRPAGPSFLALVAPIVAVIAVYAILQLLPVVSRPSRYIPMGVGMVSALGVLQLQRRPVWGAWRRAILSPRILELTLVVASLGIYAAILEAALPDGSRPVRSIGLELARIGVPLFALLIVLPFLSGLALGMNVGTVGATFPVILGLLGPAPSLLALAPTIVLSYACGFMGQLLSPVHACMIVNNQYFKIPLYRSLRGLLPPTLLLGVGTVLYSRALAWLLSLMAAIG